MFFEGNSDLDKSFHFYEPVIYFYLFILTTVISSVKRGSRQVSYSNLDKPQIYYLSST